MVLTLDDANTIYKKYEYNNFYYKIGQATTKPIDFFDTKLMIDTTDCSLFYGLVVNNIFWTGGYYVKSKATGEYHMEDLIDPSDEFGLMTRTGFFADYDLYLHMAVDKNINFNPMNLEWHPVSSLTMNVYDDEYVPKKIYLDFHGNSVPESVFMGSCYNSQSTPSIEVDVEEDSTGYYIEAVIDDLSMPLFCIGYDGFVFYGKVNHLKKLPILIADTLYKGTPQKIRLRTVDNNYLSDFQAYYQGRKLKDNIIDLPYDCPDYVDFTIDLLDTDYVNGTVKLKAPTTLYNVNSTHDLTYALENNIRTFKINILDISEFTLDNCTILDSNIGSSEAEYNNVTFHNCTYYDYGKNNFTNTLFDECTIRKGGTIVSNYINCTLSECNAIGMEFVFTGTVKDNTFTNSLIISDGSITIIGNSFNGKYDKSYFPSFLYLTGDYNVTGNTFTLDDEWMELEFNMCIIKTVELNTNGFINTNTFNLNIIYEDEDPNTFYYNIVDDDKIKAVRL